MSDLLSPRGKGLKIPKSVKKTKFELPIISSPNVKNKKIDSKKRMVSSVKKRKKDNKKESMVLVNEIEMKQKYNEICNLYRTPYDLCVKCLESFPSKRNPDIVKLIKSYLNDLIGLVDLISRIKSSHHFDQVLELIAEKLKYKYVPPKRFVCRFGDKGTHFSILLKGKIMFLVPKLIKCYLNKTEYVNYLLKLKKYGEHELLKRLLMLNQQYFDLGENFEVFLKDYMKSYIRHTKKHPTFISNELYYSIKNVLEESDEQAKKQNNEEEDYPNSHRNFNEEITPEQYIERIRIPDLNLNPKDRKKVSIYFYQNANYYEGGQIYGTVALENKNNKISATAITADDCYIGTLTKEEYQTHLLSVHLKSRELLYNLISSYDIIGLAPKKAFDNRFCHMFKCIRFKRNTKILEQNKKFNSVYVFYSGKFSISLNNNIIELYDLLAKMKQIRGKILGIKQSEIKKELSEIYLKREYYLNNKYTDPEKMKFYLKKYNITISLINDKLCVGLMDTLDPESHLGLFNCVCESFISDGYDITYDSLNLINKDYPCLNNSNKISLINLEYYLKRVLLHIKEIEIKIRQYEDNLKFNKKNTNIKNIKFNTENNVADVESEKSDEDDDNYEIRRNTFNKQKKNNNNEINLVQNIGKSFQSDYKLIMRKKLSKIGKKLTFDSNNNIYNKKFENIKTIGNEIGELPSKKSSSFISRLKKSINEKEYLLHLAQCKSNKYMKIQKDEIRSLIMTKNKREYNYNYSDLSSIFNNKSKNSENKSILNNIYNILSKRGKYERILSSYLIKDIRKEENEENKINEIINDRDDREDKDMQTEEIKNVKIQKQDDNKKDLFLIDSRMKDNSRNKMNEIEKENYFFQKKNIISLDGYYSLGNKYMLDDNPIQINKKYNKQLNTNKPRKNGKLYSSDGKKSLKNIDNNKLMNVLSCSNKDKVHLVDPLMFDKFHERFLDINKRFKTVEK